MTTYCLWASSFSLSSRTSRFRFTTTLVEPVVFLFFFSQWAINAIKTQFVYHAVAKVLDPNNSNIDPNSIISLCHVNNMSDHHQDDIQKTTAYYTLAFQLTNGIPNLFGSFLVSSLSDSFGRKIGLLLPIAGQGLSYLGFGAIIIFDLSLYGFFLTELINGISGNVFPVAAAYLTDVTTESTRTFRMSVLDIVLLLTIGLVMFLYNEWLQAAGGIQGIMFIPIVCSIVMALVYVAVFLKETVKETGSPSSRQKPSAWESIKQCSSVFFVEESPVPSSSPSSSPASFSTRKANSPFLFLFTAYLFAQLHYPGQQVEMLYLMNHPLCWEPRQLGQFILVALIVYSLGTLVSTKWLARLPRVGGDVFLVVVSMVSGLLAYIVMAFMRQAWMAWLYIFLGAFKTTGCPVLRSMMSRTVPPAAYGSLYACVVVLETALDLLMGALFSFLYAQTLSWFSGFVFLVISTCFGVALMVVLIAKWLGHTHDVVESEVGGDNDVDGGSHTGADGVLSDDDQHAGHRVVDAVEC